MSRYTATSEDGTTAEVEIPDKLVRRFKSLAKSMGKLIKELREHAPEGGVYFDEETWHLMAGPSHANTYREPAMQGNSIASVFVDKSGGGGW